MALLNPESIKEGQMLAHEPRDEADHQDSKFEIEGVEFCYSSELKPELAQDGSGKMVWAQNAKSAHGRVLRLEWPREALDGRSHRQICFGECRVVVLVP
ncbi:MAG: hypothetical protein CMK74_03740 [Pseudomonadales bacterium]|nr:hypothetical protein [Pseudomonadales bacterium]|tara:strand:- start:383 stop:679 length:297 start_codon:yes stop_codon:yes gene_type:complete